MQMYSYSAEVLNFLNLVNFFQRQKSLTGDAEFCVYVIFIQWLAHVSVLILFYNNVVCSFLFFFSRVKYCHFVVCNLWPFTCLMWCFAISLEEGEDLITQLKWFVVYSYLNFTCFFVFYSLLHQEMTEPCALPVVCVWYAGSLQMNLGKFNDVWSRLNFVLKRLEIFGGQRSTLSQWDFWWV